jgi:hypothetical protein
MLVVQKTAETVTFQATAGAQTYTAEGFATQRLSPGIHTLRGTFSPPGLRDGEGLIFMFLRDFSGSGGVRIGSLVNLSGPVKQVAPCAAIYSTSQATTVTQSFSLQFEVTADLGGQGKTGHLSTRQNRPFPVSGIEAE